MSSTVRRCVLDVAEVVHVQGQLSRWFGWCWWLAILAATFLGRRARKIEESVLATCRSASSSTTWAWRWISTAPIQSREAVGAAPLEGHLEAGLAVGCR